MKRALEFAVFLAGNQMNSKITASPSECEGLKNSWSNEQLKGMSMLDLLPPGKSQVQEKIKKMASVSSLAMFKNCEELLCKRESGTVIEPLYG